MPISSPRFRARGRDSKRVVRVLAVHNGDTARAQLVINLVLDEIATALGPERFEAAVHVQRLNIARETSPKAQRARCRHAELVVALDAEHLRGLTRPLLRRHRIFTLEELTLTLESVASTPGAHAIASILERGHVAFSRSVIGAACTARGLVVFRARRKAETVEEYPARLARAISELAIGRALAS